MLYNENWGKRKRSHISKALLRAADLIEQHGFLKGRLGNLDEGMCANGAIWLAVEKHPDRFEEVATALGTSLGFPDRYKVPIWNNAPGRTAQEVIDAMRVAAHEMKGY